MMDVHPVPLTTVSASKLKLYCRCPRRYYYAYGENIREPATPETTLGTCIHEVLDRYLRHLIATRQERDLTRLYALAQELFAQHQLPADGPGSRADADLLLNRYAARSINYREIYALEMPFRVPLTVDEGIHLTGRIDRIDRITSRDAGDLLHIIDYKTGRNKLSDDDLPADLQQQAYVVAAHHLTRGRYPRFRFTLLYLRDLTRASCDAVYQPATRDALARLALTMRDDTAFVRRPSPLCRTCPAFCRCQPPRELVDRAGDQP
ncbi:MAG TPA: PD-(D/E)XK nuclease family protein [bacterium]|nr:PD-(D/E)XK nuclease family protein [bacterium]